MNQQNMKNNFTIIVDSREQCPFRFPREYPVEVGTLAAGDVTIKNYENYVTIERKELSDFISCCTSNRERFKAELQRMKAYSCRAVLVEADLADIATGNYRSKIRPECILGSTASWQSEYHVPFNFVSDHETGAKFALAIMRNWHRRLVEKMKILMEVST